MKPQSPPPLDLDVEAVPALLARIQASVAEEDYRTIEAALHTLLHIAGLLAKKTATIRRLAKLLFGVRTEKTRDVLPPTEPAAEPKAPGEGHGEGAPPKPKGHGRNGAASYRGAIRVAVAHPQLRPGDPCTDCPGTLYRMRQPVRLVRLRGEPPIQATLYELERLRCTLCGKLFPTPPPEGVGEHKYDETAASMMAMLRYGAGVPLYRLERLQQGLGIPLPASTQWDIVRQAAGPIEPAWDELLRQAAQGEIVHNDDTPMKILALMGQRAPHGTNDSAAQNGPRKRAVFTSGILSIREGVKIALFFTGPRHAGENLADVLARRARELPPPIHMCDALSRNLPDAFQTLLANCLTHGRRHFVDVVANFPDECRYVIETLADVYRTDAVAKQRAMSPAERLRWHQAQSAPRMNALHDWLTEQRDTHTVEPNSGLGQAIAYMLRHWHKLTLFLRVPSAPLDNSICERALKKAILHRNYPQFEIMLSCV